MPTPPVPAGTTPLPVLPFAPLLGTLDALFAALLVDEAEGPVNVIVVTSVRFLRLPPCQTSS